MTISRISKLIKCDTVLCNQNANYEIVSNSYKGNIYLCEDCFKTLQNTFKRTSYKWNKSNQKHLSMTN